MGWYKDFSQIFCCYKPSICLFMISLLPRSYITDVHQRYAWALLTLIYLAPILYYLFHLKLSFSRWMITSPKPLKCSPSIPATNNPSCPALNSPKSSTSRQKTISRSGSTPTSSRKSGARLRPQVRANRLPTHFRRSTRRQWKYCSKGFR